MALKIITRFIKFAGISVLQVFDFLVHTFAENKEVWPEDSFPFTDLLKSNHGIFRAEYNRLRNEKDIQNVKDFFVVETDINSDDNWKAVPIILFNHLFKENAERCPETCKIIRTLPGCCGAMFSVLEPGKYISPHRGIYKGIYRCLLTIQVAPDADCWIRVHKQKLFFRDNSCIVFDETIEHEVMNASDEPRVVLFLDIYRRLPFPLNILNNIIWGLLQRSPFVMNILTEHRRLEKTTIEKHKPAPAILQ